MESWNCWISKYQPGKQFLHLPRPPAGSAVPAVGETHDLGKLWETKSNLTNCMALYGSWRLKKQKLTVRLMPKMTLESGLEALLGTELNYLDLSLEENRHVAGDPQFCTYLRLLFGTNIAKTALVSPKYQGWQDIKIWLPVSSPGAKSVMFFCSFFRGNLHPPQGGWQDESTDAWLCMYHMWFLDL